MKKNEIKNEEQLLDVNCACLDQSNFQNVSLNNVTFENVSMKGVKITDANLSDLEIDGAQMGGAYLHNIGMPPEDHPAFDSEAAQKPLRFENCNLSNTLIDDCNLNGVEIKNCNVTGLKINGVLVSDLLKAYESSRKAFQLSTGL